ncbi:allophanate hydrolase [Massilia sp. TW-1]|uniref:Allophanate hydrolase n=1 Tax=Telluria antibiotica TaxID=2717319 RepID=A0ABX0P9R1_9BURK|nr:allophanate hydrolase [Telluria antibiotica]NIA53414.1 allophanate hydrolase [Telluria antibiotica]
MTIIDTHAAYLDGTATPGSTIEQALARIAGADRPEIWISRVDDAALRAQARALDAVLAAEGAAVLARLPLLGIPFAVKDNIDVAGMPTTAACPAFAYVPEQSAPVVDRLLAAGALLVGKTNLDQFATGLVGTRSPYGAVRNAVDPAYVSGGSSSGSAVAVALGMIGFALGTDTAGSGRVPAGLNGIVGLKPTRGLLSTRGVVPACRTLDCVSVFAPDVADAWKVLQVAAGHDARDPYSRPISMQGVRRRGYRIAVPAQLEFFGDAAAQAAFEATLARLRDLPGCTFGTVDYTPFRAAAALLYQGPWVAERHAAVGAFIDAQPDAAHPVVAGIIGQANGYDATDAFQGQYMLAALRRAAEDALADYDFLLVPTTPTMPRISDVLERPVELNSQLGYYTNFVNFFDMAALAVPGQNRADGLPAGVTLIGNAGSDHMLATAAAALLGGADANALAADPLPFREPTVQVAVVGAHLEGQPLNWQLLERGARKMAATHTSPNYRLYALPGTTPPKPGLARVDGEGTAIAIEVWELPLRRFGEFVAEIPAPLGIGSLELADGRWVKGFICEPAAIAGATDISMFGGWRAYLTSQL